MVKLTDDEMKRIDRNGIEYLINCNKELLTSWALTSKMRKDIEDEIKWLESLIK